LFQEDLYRMKCWIRKIVSKNIESIDKMNLTRLKASPPITGWPRAIALIAIYTKLKIPPVRSSKTLARENPTVLLRE